MMEIALPKSHVLSAKWKTEGVREDASGDHEDGEEDDDELPCVNELPYCFYNEVCVCFDLFYSNNLTATIIITRCSIR